MFKKLIMTSMFFITLMFSHMALAGGCDKYNAFHSTQAHSTTICSCDSCHLGSLNRGTAPTTCIGCHMGARPAAPQKPPSHISTSSIGCENCHGVTTFASARMNHSVVSGQTCNSCHGVSASAPKKPSDHIQTTADCSVCHKTSSWDANMNHTGIVSNCVQCHLKDKRSSHIPTTLSCENCHSGTNTWSNGKYTHTGAEDCNSCHGNSSIANVTQKTATHPVTTASCLTCHSGTVTFSCALNEFKSFVEKIYAYISTSTLFS
jgi:hypothetical protein